MVFLICLLFLYINSLLYKNSDFGVFSRYFSILFRFRNVLLHFVILTVHKIIFHTKKHRLGFIKTVFFFKMIVFIIIKNFKEFNIVQWNKYLSFINTRYLPCCFIFFRYSAGEQPIAFLNLVEK